MNTQPDSNTPAHPSLNPRLWGGRNDFAASLLPANFADNVLRAARLQRAAAARPLAWRFFHNPFALSALTASACFAAVVFFHTQSVNQANAENLADWRDFAAQIASLDPL